MKEERLFEAMGGIDPALLKRSDQKTRRRPVWPAIAAAAACLALVLSVRTLFPWAESPPYNTPSVTVPPDSQPSATVPAPKPPALTLTGGEVGQLYVCHLLHQKKAAPDFTINVNREMYTIAERGGTYVIQPAIPTTLDTPPIDMTITHMDGVDVEEAARLMADWLKATYAQSGEPTDSQLGPVLRAGDGSAWDAAQSEVHIFPDEAGGAFTLVMRYFTEADEGHATRFRDMIGTFQVIGTRQKPAWMESLYAVSARWMSSIFSNRIEDAPDPVDLTDSLVLGYGEDVSGELTLAGIDYTVDDETQPTSAVVSVKHRLSTEDSYNFLTMELTLRDGQWILTGAGIEK